MADMFNLLARFIIFSNDFNAHLNDIAEVLAKLSDAANLHINLSKCKFAARELPYSTKKLEIIESWPVPTTTQEVHSFIGLAGYLRPFIPHFAIRTTPLTNLPKNDVPFSWNTKQQQAFDDIKSALCCPPLLRFPLPNMPFEIHADGACTSGIGAIFGQRDPENNGFFAIE